MRESLFVIRARLRVRSGKTEMFLHATKNADPGSLEDVTGGFDVSGAQGAAPKDRRVSFQPWRLMCELERFYGLPDCATLHLHLLPCVCVCVGVCVCVCGWVGG